MFVKLMRRFLLCCTNIYPCQKNDLKNKNFAVWTACYVRQTNVGHFFFSFQPLCESYFSNLESSTLGSKAEFGPNGSETSKIQKMTRWRLWIEFPDFVRFLYDKLFPISDFFEETIYIIARFARINAQWYIFVSFYPLWNPLFCYLDSTIMGPKAKFGQSGVDQW